MRELVNEELFDYDKPEQIVAVVWWLTYLLGGKVAFPMDEQFWLTNFPEGTQLVMRVEDNQPVLVAEIKGNSE